MQHPHEARVSGAGPSLYLSSYNQLMDNDGSGGLRRYDPTSIGLITAMQERENAVREKNTAIAEKKAALKERDTALMQRDIACAERDTAFVERDRAVTALNIAKAQWEACPTCSSWHRQSLAQKFAQPVNLGENPRFAEAAAPSILPAELPQGAAGAMEAAGSKKRKRNRKPKDNQKQQGKDSGSNKKKHSPAVATNSSVSPTPSKLKVPQVDSSKFSDQSKPQNVPSQKEIFGDSSVTNGSYDHSTIPSPYCSCTGVNQQCYRWGSGGWQSACCTNQISMYPLPMNPKKKGCRVAGRKMSAGAFGRLLERLVSDGWDVATPVDLRNYWSKHGTNRYVTIK